ncbi:hypothetical protein KEM60_02476 [Austwickia sp. TVS 96-490-7B]|uniref:DUF3263 domain-containing protein n=1 Tax=Austwickia sp. TVS 96-490-7B TaxID=2830843 RepID=UPI001C579C5C|nr:DUF3263 domain-containing protein [Austwickia sp. TVS 96-490-7B]MBW3086264.1 hypothetical protein [Austwickia sp. TVS 96-490-7B]
MRRRRSTGLSNRDRSVIDLEREWGQSPDVLHFKYEAAHRDLGLSPTGYALVLNGLIADPAAFEYDPVTIGRLRDVQRTRRTPGLG